MANLVEFLIACLPDERAKLGPLFDRFNEAFPDGSVPSVERPFVLSSTDIDLLLELASLHRSQTLLLALASMGTVELDAEQKIKDPRDPLIGRRDPAIEVALIDKAIAQQSSARQHEGATPKFVYGLSGNPPTLNHLYFIKHLLTQGDVSVVLNAQSPLKELDSYVAPNIRFEMLQGMLHSSDESFSRCHLSRLEIDRVAPSRMVVTMSMLVLLSDTKERHTLVLGLDALPVFTRWYKYASLARLCDLKFYPRSGEVLADAVMKHHLETLEEEGVHQVQMVFNTEADAASFLEKNPGYKASVEIIPDIGEGSATAVRAYYLDKSLDTDVLPGPATHPAVHELIQHHRLFRKPPEAAAGKGTDRDGPGRTPTIS